MANNFLNKLGSAASIIGKQTAKAASAVGKKSSELAGKGKLSLDISNRQNKLVKLKSDLGESAYDCLKEGAPFTEDLWGEMVAQMKEIEHEIAELEEQKDMIGKDDDGIEYRATDDEYVEPVAAEVLDEKPVVEIAPKVEASIEEEPSTPVDVTPEISKQSSAPSGPLVKKASSTLSGPLSNKED